MDNRNWTPIRKGDIYCSPACGANCTHKAYEEATGKAKKLAEKCTKEIGGEWEIRVHENLGWHWCVIQKKTNICISYGGYLSQGDYYTVALGGGTPSQVSLHPQTFKSPKEAYDCQIQAIKEEAEVWNRILENAN
jgi:hypothetical protein